MGNEFGCLGREDRRPHPRRQRYYTSAPRPVAVSEEDVLRLRAFTGADRDACIRVLLDCNGNMHAAAGRLLLSGGREIMSVTLPQNATAGTKVTVQTPRGIVEVTVPKSGYCGGDTLTFNLPRAAAPAVAAHEYSEPAAIPVVQAIAPGDDAANASSHSNDPSSSAAGSDATTAPGGSDQVIVDAVAVPVSAQPPQAHDIYYDDDVYVRPCRYGRYPYRYGRYEPYYYDPFLGQGLLFGALLAAPLMCAPLYF